MAVRAALPALAPPRLRRRPSRLCWAGRSRWLGRSRRTGWPHSRPQSRFSAFYRPITARAAPFALADPAPVSTLVALHGDRCSGCARSAGCWCADCGRRYACRPSLACRRFLPAAGAASHRDTAALLVPKIKRPSSHLCRTASRSGVFAACCFSSGRRAHPCTSCRRKSRA